MRQLSLLKRRPRKSILLARSHLEIVRRPCVGEYEALLTPGADLGFQRGLIHPGSGPPCQGGHGQGSWAALLAPAQGLPWLLGSLGKPCLASSRRFAFNSSFWARQSHLLGLWKQEGKGSCGSGVKRGELWFRVLATRLLLFCLCWVPGRGFMMFVFRPVWGGHLNDLLLCCVNNGVCTEFI